MPQEILDDQQHSPESDPTLSPLMSISLQLGFALCSMVLYFLGYSFYLSAELGIGLITLIQLTLNFKSKSFVRNTAIDFLRLFGASLLLVGIFFQVFPYPNATLLQSIGLLILIAYYSIWILINEKQDYFFFLVKFMQGVSIGSFCWGIRTQIFHRADLWFLTSFIFSVAIILILLIHYIRNKNILPRLLIHLPLVIWVLFIQLAFIGTKIF